MVRLVFDVLQIPFEYIGDSALKNLVFAETTKAFFFEWCLHPQYFWDDRTAEEISPLAIEVVEPMSWGIRGGFYSQLCDLKC